MQNKALLPELKTAPAVFAVGEEYHIIVPVKSPLLFSVIVAGEEFFDHSNGIVRSAKPVHTVRVPMALLDNAREYTVAYRKIIERKPYFTETEDKVFATYAFRPVPTEGEVRLYHLADTHGCFEKPAAAARYFGESLDLLVLNGDIPDHSGNLENFDLIFEFCDALTGGEIPVVFSRGNHDMRGIFAESIAEYTPTDNGNSYFTFRLGRLWGMVLDCGEDKPEEHAAYGYTNCCHSFRRAQTRFIERVIQNSATEYAAPNVKWRLVVAHHPFSFRMPEPFNIEEPLYAEWTRLLGEHVKPDALLSGHLHYTSYKLGGGELDAAGAIPVVVGSAVKREEKKVVAYTGVGLTFGEQDIKVEFTNDALEAVESHVLPLAANKG